ncbi:MAG: hypothetical protein NVS3B8_13850 [Chitinophagaceae bacterium]
MPNPYARVIVRQSLRVKQIDLMAVKGSIVHGTVLFKENMDHSVSIVITIQNTKKDSIYLSQINNGSIESPGLMAMPFPVMKGSGSFATQIIFNIKSITNASDSIVKLTYDDLIRFPGYVSVQIAGLPINKIVAAGNINQHFPVVTEVNKHSK